MKTIINILGMKFYLWIYGEKDVDLYKEWEAGTILNLKWYITQEDQWDALRVSFQDDQVVMLPREEQGSVFGYIWCSKEGMKPRSEDYAHGLAGMRYGWEKAKETAFFDATSLEFTWRLAASRRIHSYMEWKANQMKAPAPMRKDTPTLTLENKPDLFKTKITDLSFREKLQRYLRKPTTKVYAAIIDEFNTFDNDRRAEIIIKLESSVVSKHGHIAELIEEMAITTQMPKKLEEIAEEAHQLPAGL